MSPSLSLFCTMAQDFTSAEEIALRRWKRPTLDENPPGPSVAARREGREWRKDDTDGSGEPREAADGQLLGNVKRTFLSVRVALLAVLWALDDGVSVRLGSWCFMDETIPVFPLASDGCCVRFSRQSTLFPSTSNRLRATQSCCSIVVSAL